MTSTSVRLHLVRHGRAAAGWNVDPDPGLDEIGRVQSLAVTDSLGALQPCTLYTSPLRRCRETAKPLAERWGREPLIDPRVGEIPSPLGHSLDTRVDWLRAAMSGTWSDLIATNGARYERFRTDLLEALASIQHDAVVYSHFVAINVVVGAAMGDDRVVIASLDNCSVTTVTSDRCGGFAIEQIGNEADTLIR